MQIMGVYRNCICDIPARYWLHPYATSVSLATDTQDRRNASNGWVIIGFTSMGLLAIICYVGWWYQRYLRKAFVKHIEALFGEILTAQTTSGEFSPAN